MSEITARPGKGIIVVLAGISALGSLAIHMLVPALSQLAHDLAVSASQAQLAVSIYLLGLGAGQLVSGPAVDRLGTKPVLTLGLVLYIIGAAASAFAPSLPTLLWARVMQAMAGAAGLVAARVLVGEIFGRGDAARHQATLMMFVLISPALAPVFGGLIASVAGWRAIPTLLSVAALIALATSRRTLPQRRDEVRRGDRPHILSDWKRLFGNRRFVWTTVALAGSSSALYLFLASAAFLLVRDFGLSEEQAGPCFLAVALGGICGTRAVAPLAKHFDALVVGLGCVLAGSLILLGLALSGFIGAAALIAPMILVGIGAGIAGPSAMSVLMFVEEGLAGTAISLAGASQMLASSAATAAIGQFAPIDTLRLAIAMSLVAVIAIAGGLAGRNS